MVYVTKGNTCRGSSIVENFIGTNLLQRQQDNLPGKRTCHIYRDQQLFKIMAVKKKQEMQLDIVLEHN